VRIEYIVRVLDAFRRLDLPRGPFLFGYYFGGRHSIAEIMRASGLKYTTVYSTLSYLVNLGVVRVTMIPGDRNKYYVLTRSSFRDGAWEYRVYDDQVVVAYKPR